LARDITELPKKEEEVLKSNRFACGEKKNGSEAFPCSARGESIHLKEQMSQHLSIE
jgi:hypothetical protein